MGRSGIVLAILVLIGCYLFATSIPSKEDGSSAATAANWFEHLLPTEFEPWPSSSPSHVDYDYDDDDENNSAGPFIGIDFGATSSRVGFYNDGKVEIIPNDQGSFTTPSCVAFTDSSETPPLVGEAAKNQAAVNPERTIFEVNRLIGRKFEDKEVQSIMKLVPYKIVNKEGKPYIQVQFKDGDTKVFSPEEISAMILTRLKETAEAYIGKKITNAVVPVPSYFDDDQIQAIRDACSIAGLNVKLTHNQFAIAYANRLHEVASRKNVIVVDIGDEAFAFTIFEIGHGAIYYLADTHLGGHDYNQRIMEYLIKLIKNKYGKDVSNDNKALVKLRVEADRVKRALSSQHQVRVELFEDLFETVTFEELNNDLFMGLVKKAFEEAPRRLEKHHIDDIIVVGGSTNVPKIQQLLRGYFNGKVEPMKGADEAVAAIGAALAGYPPIRNPGSAIGL